MGQKKKPTKRTELTKLKRRGNPEAKALSTLPHLRTKIVPDKKKEKNLTLTRKPIKNPQEE